MWIRTSTEFYFRFILDMDRSPGFGSASWTWIGHPVSGLPLLTSRPFKTWFPFGSVALPLNLASNGNSPDRSTKSTRSHLNVLPQLVNTGFQVLFHSPHGVLFTVPSQYYALSVTKEYLALEGGPSDFPQGSTCLMVLWIPPAAYHFHVQAVPSQYYALSVTKEYLALEGGPSDFPQGSTCLMVLWIPPAAYHFHVQGFHFLWPAFPGSSINGSAHFLRSLTPACTHAGLGSSGFARRYFRNRCFFLFLRLLRCFSSPGSRPMAMDLP